MLKRIVVLMAFVVSSAIAGESSVDFTLKDIQGKTHHLSDYRGKWVIVNYWATWCPPCLDEIPELSDFHEKHKATDAVVIGINYEEDVDPKNLQTFVDEYLISYPILRADMNITGPFGDIYGLPSTFIVSPQGNIVAHKVGGVTQVQLEKLISSEKLKLAKKKV